MRPSLALNTFMLMHEAAPQTLALAAKSVNLSIIYCRSDKRRYSLALK